MTTTNKSTCGQSRGLLRLNLTIQTLVGLSGRNLPIPQRARTLVEIIRSKND